MAASVRSTCAGLCVVALATFSNPLSCGSNGSQSKSNTDTVHAQTMDAAGKWLRAEVVPFDTAEPSGPIDDLERLRQIVGNAHVVSLGEATHGTSEFFKMKHRVLRFLVERMGFTAFGIEATWPEANRLNRYVHTGEGDPAVLLSGLYFWTWNTQEVLDMIQWMRAYNQAGHDISFYGFDMQYPGMAIDNVTTFVARVDPNFSADFAQHVSCLAKYGNGPQGWTTTAQYPSQTQAYRDACRQDLLWVKEALSARRVQYETVSSHDEWAIAVQSATVAIQYEEMASNRRSRDEAMADNVKWLVDEMPSDGKIVLWAHNGHVNTAGSSTYPAMGDKLRVMFGQDMVIVGFDFARGSFNAIGLSGSTYTPLTSHRVDNPPDYSYEDYFLSADLPRFFLDLRGRDKRADTPAWLVGPSMMRSIGAVYADSNPSGYLYQTPLPARFDVVIFFADTSPSRLLPFAYPPVFSQPTAATSDAARAVSGPALYAAPGLPGERLLVVRSHERPPRTGGNPDR